MQADWSSLAGELRLWALAGKAPRLWLRDDDATQPSAPLDRLLSLCDRCQVPAVLAVIPESCGAQLASRLEETEKFCVAVHGWRHANHAPAGEKKQELGKHRPSSEILAELQRGFAKLKALHAGKFLPILVPPWNRMDGDLLTHLPAIGFKGVSSYGDALLDRMKPGFPVINTHLDIMDWSSRRGRDHATLVACLVAHLRKSRESDRHPVGILAHHRDHDETAWTFLDQLFENIEVAAMCRWLTGGDLFSKEGSLKD